MTRFLLVGLSFLVLVIGAGCAPDAGVTDSMKYDPELYKAHIQNIEELVTKEEAGPNDGSTLYKHAADLAGAMGKNIDNHMVRETIQNRLMSFGEQFSQQEEKGMQVDVAEMRTMWKKVREDLFRDASWFKKI